jgi:hypothetical protein
MIDMSNKNTSALFNAYRLTINAMRTTGDALRAANSEALLQKCRVMDEKHQAVYHRRPLSYEQCQELNERQRACEKSLADNRAKMIELGRDIARFCMIVDANTTADERIDAFNMEPGAFDHSVATMGHLIFCGACKPNHPDRHSEFDVIHHALTLACADYCDNLTVGPGVIAIEHVASENLIHVLMDSNPSPGELYDREDDEDEESDDDSSAFFVGAPFGIRECDPRMMDEEIEQQCSVSGGSAQPLRDWGVHAQVVVFPEVTEANLRAAEKEVGLSDSIRPPRADGKPRYTCLELSTMFVNNDGIHAPDSPLSRLEAKQEAEVL